MNLKAAGALGSDMVVLEFREDGAQVDESGLDAVSHQNAGRTEHHLVDARAEVLSNPLRDLTGGTRNEDLVLDQRLGSRRSRPRDRPALRPRGASMCSAPS